MEVEQFHPEEVEKGAMQDGDDEMEDEEDSGKGAMKKFPALSAQQMQSGKSELRRIRCPPHRLTPLRNNWDSIVSPIVEHMKLQIRYVRHPHLHPPRCCCRKMLPGPAHDEFPGMTIFMDSPSRFT